MAERRAALRISRPQRNPTLMRGTRTRPLDGCRKGGRIAVAILREVAAIGRVGRWRDVEGLRTSRGRRWCDGARLLGCSGRAGDSTHLQPDYSNVFIERVGLLSTMSPALVALGSRRGARLSFGPRTSPSPRISAPGAFVHRASPNGASPRPSNTRQMPPQHCSRTFAVAGSTHLRMHSKRCVVLRGLSAAWPLPARLSPHVFPASRSALADRRSDSRNASLRMYPAGRPRNTACDAELQNVI